MADEGYRLPNDVEVVTHVLYTDMQLRGPLALVVTASISLSAVAVLIVAIIISEFTSCHRFIRSQVGASFLSLVVSDLLQATGSVMNAKWVTTKRVSTGHFCTTQAALKQTGDVGTALWSLVIAFHTFCLLFLRVRLPDYLFYTIFAAVWIFIAFIVMLGPVILQTVNQGPFWGISGHWCWITNGYHVEQLTTQYLFMFITAGTSFVLYSLIYFRLRGNIQGYWGTLKFVRAKQPWLEDDTSDSPAPMAGKQMLWYPVAYTIVILPIAICRWNTAFGHEVPYWAIMTADSIFMLSGFVNVVLYTTTRKIVSMRAVFSHSHIFHSTSAWRRQEKGTQCRTHLDAMEFATPTAYSHKRCGTCESSTPSAASPRTCHSRSETLSEGTRGDSGKISSSVPELWRIYNINSRERSQARDPSQDYAGTGGLLDITAAPPVLALTSEREDRQRPSNPHNDSKLSLPRTVPREPRPEDIYSGISHTASDISLTTDDAPSPHHKRFSGWSLPSVRGGSRKQRSSMGDHESMHVELEEMRFAPPSPEPARRDALHQSQPEDLKPPSRNCSPSPDC